MKSPVNARLALVTGGGRGIGAATAKRLASRGYRVALVARSATQLEETAHAIRNAGGDATPLPCDLRVAAQVDTLLRRVTRELGNIDILVNNAGSGGPYLPATDVPDALWDELFSLNVTTPMRLIRAVLPGMIERRFGRIVNVASVLALRGAAGSSAYAASKHALLGYTRSVALEVASAGVSVSAVCPGYVRTDMTAERLTDPTQLDPALMPAGRVLEADEVADAIVRLIEEDPARSNGRVVQPGVD
jgi:3-oxoacyl-[acyl-carrier protein] reductase